MKFNYDPADCLDAMFFNSGKNRHHNDSFTDCIRVIFFNVDMTRGSSRDNIGVANYSHAHFLQQVMLLSSRFLLGHGHEPLRFGYKESALSMQHFAPSSFPLGLGPELPSLDLERSALLYQQLGSLALHSGMAMSLSSLDLG